MAEICLNTTLKWYSQTSPIYAANHLLVLCFPTRTTLILFITICCLFDISIQTKLIKLQTKIHLISYIAKYTSNKNIFYKGVATIAQNYVKTILYFASIQSSFMLFIF